MPQPPSLDSSEEILIAPTSLPFKPLRAGLEGSLNASSSPESFSDSVTFGEKGPSSPLPPSFPLLFSAAQSCLRSLNKQAVLSHIAST